MLVVEFLLKASCVHMLCDTVDMYVYRRIAVYLSALFLTFLLSLDKTLRFFIHVIFP